MMAGHLEPTNRPCGANLSQRRRRASNPRIDFYPSESALACFRARQSQERPGSVRGTNSAVLDAIIEEWAELTGINKRRKSKLMSSGDRPELTDANARASNSGAAKAAENKSKQSGGRVPCGARRRRDGEPCEALSVPGKLRCKWHGGCSTGPRTDRGRMLARRNLRQFRVGTAS